MPRPRLLISDFTGGEVSPRLDTRADLERYARSLRRCENFLIAQQGGAMLRRGTKWLGMSGASTANSRYLIPWRGSGLGIPDIIFEINQNRLLGWTSTGRIDVGGLPYQVNLPGLSVPDGVVLQYAQRANILAIAVSTGPPILVKVNSLTSWTVTTVGRTLLPTRNFNDAASPTRQTASFDFKFVGFSQGNTYNVYVNDKAVEQRTGGPRGTPPFPSSPIPFAYSSTDAVNVQRLSEAIARSTLVGSEEYVAVTTVVPGTYRVVLSGPASGLPVKLKPVPNIESTALRIEQLTNQDGTGGEELAWSYSTVVKDGGVYYLCLTPHVSAAGSPPAGNPNWQALAGAPAWEATFPSPDWIGTPGTSYGLGNRGWPVAVAFHDQRLVLAGTSTLPLTVWGSAIGSTENFVLGTEDDQAFSRDLDAAESPAIYWMVSRNGLVVGTSAGIWVLNGQTTLTPTDFQAIRAVGDSVAPRGGEVVGNEVLFISADRRQLRTFRYSSLTGPYEVVELSVLAEHLARYRLRKVVYCEDPQPLLFVLTDQPGLLLAVTYNKQGELLAFARTTINGTIDDIARCKCQDSDGNALLLAMRRNDGFYDWLDVEKLDYPVLRSEADSLASTRSVHLDGWRQLTHSGGYIYGLLHLIGKTVTVQDSTSGAVIGSGTVTATNPVPSTPLTVSAPGFEVAGTWVYVNTTRVGGAAHTGSFGAKLTSSLGVVASVTSANIAATAGRNYLAKVWWKVPAAPTAALVTAIKMSFYDGGGALLTSKKVQIYTDIPIGVWTQSTVQSEAPSGTANIKLSAEYNELGGAASDLYVDDFALLEGLSYDGRVQVTATNAYVGVPFVGSLVTTEPAAGNPAGTSIGNQKRWSDVQMSVYQSALPKLDGDRPSDYNQAGGAYRSNPYEQRTGDYEVNTLGWRDGALTIEQDLPNETQIVGLFGNLQVGVG